MILGEVKVRFIKVANKAKVAVKGSKISRLRHIGNAYKANKAINRSSNRESNQLIKTKSLGSQSIESYVNSMERLIEALFDITKSAHTFYVVNKDI